jgi:hypothetical protein
MSQQYNTMEVTDKQMYELLDKFIPVMETLQKIAGNWDGDFPGLEEDTAHFALEVFDEGDKFIKHLAEFREFTK